MANIKILVGSTYGNASQIAEDCADRLQGLGHQVTLMLEPTYEQAVVDTDVILVCTATIGQGEVPDNLLPLYNQLKTSFPMMTGVRYGVIALGDSSYEDYAEGGKQMDELMQDLQAKRVGQVLFIDSCETPDPDEAAATWIESWAPQL
ncbi:MAG: flavodoxin [Amphritea sp.]